MKLGRLMIVAREKTIGSVVREVLGTGYGRGGSEGKVDQGKNRHSDPAITIRSWTKEWMIQYR